MIQHSTNPVAQHPVISTALLTVGLAAVVTYLLLDHHESKPWMRRFEDYSDDLQDRVGDFREDAVERLSKHASKISRGVHALADRAHDFWS